MILRHQCWCCLRRTGTAKGFTVRSFDETESSSVVLGVVYTEAQNGVVLEAVRRGAQNRVGIFHKLSLPMSVSNLSSYNPHPSPEGTKADPISNGNNVPCRPSQRN
jgi:hypothetical protein